MEEIPIGFQIKKLREEMGLSQRQLGIRAGIDRGYISLIESGKTCSMTLRVAEKIAKGLGRTTLKALFRYLLSRDDHLPCLWLTEERRPLTRNGFQTAVKRLGKYPFITRNLYEIFIIEHKISLDNP